MKQIEILNQFFKFKGKLGTQFCTAVKTDRNLNVTEITFISVANTKKLPADWQNEKKKHTTTAISTVEPIKQTLNGLGMTYAPAATAVQVLNTVVPDSMGEEMHNALVSLKKAVGDVSNFVAERLQFSLEELAQRLAAEQVDAVALSIYNIEAREQGFIIGDQTGVGKGRVAAAMIRYAIVQGYKPIFITEKPNLFTDFYRDLNDIGCPYYRPFIVNGNESKTKIKDMQGNIIFEPDDPKTQTEIINKALETGKIPADYDFIMATYSQFSDKELTPKKQFLVRMAADNVCVLDEAHNAGGSIGKQQKGADGSMTVKGGSNTAQFFLDVVYRVKGVVFLSATFAKRPDNMPIYCIKTCIGEASLPLDKMVEAITKGGVALQEVLSSNVVKEGQMVRREKSKDQITVNYITLDKAGKAKFEINDVEKQHKIALDSVTELMRDIIKFQTDYIAPIVDSLNKINAAANINIEQRKGTESLGVDNQDFASKTFQIVNQLLFSIKAKEVANRAVWNLQNGKKVVIAFANTMEEMLNNLGANEGDTINPDYSVSLLSGLDSTRRITEKDDAGGSSYRMIDFDEIGEEGTKFYKYLVSKIRKNTSGITISPIDLMKHVIDEAGFEVSEVTGRKFQLNFSKDLSKATIASRRKENIADAYRRFQNNEVDVLFINTSGSTGASAHAIPTASVKPDRVKQRVMIIAQPELNISTEVQKRGRIDRTGQIYPPIYEYITSAIPAEKRFMMMLQKKLKSLDANTTSNQKQSKNVVDYDDFLNKYGDEVVINYLKENEDFNTALGDPLKIKADDEKSVVKEGAISKITGRVALLTTKEQEEFYEIMLESYRNFIDFKIQEGTYDLEMETMNLEAETINKTATISAKGAGKSVFSAPTFEETCMINVLKKPFAKKELDEKIKEAQSKTDNQKIAADYKQSMLGAYEKRKTIIEAKWNKAIENIPNEKGFKEAADTHKYTEDRKIEIEESRIADKQREQDKLNNQFTSINPLIEAFTAGSVWNFAWGERQDMTLPCVCLGVNINPKSKNPYAPSNMFVEFAVSDSTRYFKLNFANDQRMALQSIRSAARWSFKNDLIEKWEEYTAKRSANREKRVIITGNILQAFDRDEYAKGGKLVSFTRKNGKVEKGILLRSDVSEKLTETNTRIEAKVSVPIEKAKKHILNLPPNSLYQCSGNFYIAKKYYGDTFQLVTNSGSKSEFEWLIQNPHLMELADSDYGFTLSRRNWQAEFEKADMPHVIDELQSLGVNVVITGTPAEELQQELADNSGKSGSNWKKLSWDENNIPKLSSKPVTPKKNDNNRLRLLELEMEMEIAIMEMELEMGAYKSVAGL